MTYRMRFEIPNCPQCGQQATGTREIIEAVALLDFTSKDEATYAGQTVSGEQYTLAHGPNQVELTCGNGHHWPSYLLDPAAG